MEDGNFSLHFTKVSSLSVTLEEKKKKNFTVILITTFNTQH